MMQLQTLVDQPAHVAGLRRWKEATDLLDARSVPGRFVLAHAAKCAPAAVADGLGEAVVLDHALDIQVFQPDNAMLVDQAVAELVKEVLTLPGHTPVLAGYRDAGLVPVGAALLLAGQASLQAFQLAFRPAQVLRMLDLLPGGQDGEVLEADIDADRWPAVVFGQFDLHFALDRRVELAALGSRYGDVLRRPFHAAVEDSPDPAHLGKIDALAVETETLRVADSLLIVSGLEARVLSSLLEEVLVGSVEVFQLLLQDLGVGVSQPGVIFRSLQISEQGGRVGIGQPFAVLFIVLFARRKAPVEHVAGMTELDGQGSPLRLVGIDAIAEGSMNDHTFFWSWMYCCTASMVTAPTVEMKRLRVHKVGNRFLSQGNSFLNMCEVYPLIMPTTLLTPLLGSTSIRRCT